MEGAAGSLEETSEKLPPAMQAGEIVEAFKIVGRSCSVMHRE
jgi:hypothetical protein